MSSSQTSEGPPLVGRTVELGLLDRRVAEAVAGHGGLVLLAGEPGIGKSRLAEEAGRRARRRGCRVVWGRCRETGGAPPFWPWTQAVRALVPDGTDDRLVDLQPLLGGRSEAPREADRFRLFDTVLALLSDCADRQPLVLVLDDLHRADHGSLLLLDFVASVLRDRPLLLIGTFRDTEVGPQHALAALVGERAGEAGVDCLTLVGLSPAETARLVAGLAPAEAGIPVTDLQRRSDGNPFFLTELLRLPPGSGRSVPATVTAAIRTRVDRLPAATRRVLTLAAVVGREFDAPVLAALAEVPADRIEARLAPAVVGGLVEAGRHAATGYRFTHVLVRDALYAAIAAPQRAALHDRMVQVLTTPCGGSASEAADLASHAARAVRGPQDRRRAVRLATDAAAEARDRLAHEEAAAWFERALELGPDGPDERFALLVELGRCAGRAARMQQSRSAYEQAWQLAVTGDRPERPAEVALGLGEVVDSPGTVDVDLVQMLEESLRRADPADRLTRVRLTARLAVAIYWGPRLREARSLASEAVAAARRSGDRRALGVALRAQQFVLRGPGHLGERLRLGEELVTQAHALGDEQLEIQARRMLIADRWQVDPSSADADLQALDLLAQRTRRPVARWYVLVNRCIRASLGGSAESALQLIEQAASYGRRIGAHPAPMYGLLQRCSVLRTCGRGAEAEEDLRATILEYPRVPAFRCLLTLLLAEAGRREEAEALLEELVADDCRAVSPDALWLSALAQLTTAAARLGRRADAAALHRLLEPHAGGVVMQGVVVWEGAVDHYRGLAAATLGRWDEAERLLRAGLRLHEAWAAVPHIRASLDALDVVRRSRAGSSGRPAVELTLREQEVLRLLAGGAANKQIARRLAISVHTVERHVTNVYTKIGAHNRAEATAYALRRSG